MLHKCRLLLLVLLALMGYVLGTGCVYTVNCNSPDSKCKLDEVNTRIESASSTFSNQVCPVFGTDSQCCSDIQFHNLEAQFRLITSVFGRTGCDICVANLKHLWCTLLCHEEQALWISFDEHDNMIVSIKETTAKQLYKSCKKVPQAKKMGLADEKRLLEQQTQLASEFSMFKVQFEVVDDSQNALALDVEPCSSEKDVVHGYSVRQCTCSTCREACYQAEFHEAKNLQVAGMDWLVIAAAYLCLACFVIGLIYIRFFRKDEDTNHIKSV